MSRLEEFRKANPQYKILSVDDSAFNQFGVVYHYDVSDVEKVMNQYKIPAKGSNYIASIPDLEATDTIKKIKRDIYADMPVDAGVTIGHSDNFTAFEYHQCSETNIMLNDVVMVLAKRQTLEEHGNIDPNREAKMFYVPKGTVIELYNDSLHYAPIQVTKAGYKVIVVVIHGTNSLLPKDVKSANPRVVKKGKFQVVHASRKDKIAQGYQVALIGKLIQTTPLES